MNSWKRNSWYKSFRCSLEALFHNKSVPLLKLKREIWLFMCTLLRNNPNTRVLYSYFHMVHALYAFSRFHAPFRVSSRCSPRQFSSAQVELSSCHCRLMQFSAITILRACWCNALLNIAQVSHLICFEGEEK